MYDRPSLPPLLIFDIFSNSSERTGVVENAFSPSRGIEEGCCMLLTVAAAALAAVRGEAIIVNGGGRSAAQGIAQSRSVGYISYPRVPP